MHEFQSKTFFHLINDSLCLAGVDPEGKKIFYSISGPYFSVERESGIVKLIKALDRETVSKLETIITITGN